MILAEETINQAIRHAINGALDIPEHAIRAQQNDGLVPDNDGAGYATVQLILDGSIGVPYLEYLDLYPIATSYRQISYSLNFHRLGAYDRARTVAGALVREDVQAIFQTVGLATKIPGIIRNISEPNPPGWEERAQFDLDLDYVQRIGVPDEPGAIPTAAIMAYSMDMLFNNTTTSLTCGD